MKSIYLGKWLMAVGLLALPFAGGCLQEAVSSTTNAAPPITTVAASNASPAVLAPATNAAAVEGTNDVIEVPEVDIADADFKPVQTDKPVPVNVRTNGPLGEVIRMAESGVDQAVLLAFVTNSGSIFSLSADEVIYLNDIGVPSEVVTSMLYHDQVLRGSIPAATAAAPVAEATAPAAPQSAYAIAPQNPAAIAPQAAAPPPQQAQAAPVQDASAPPPPADAVPQAAPAPAAQSVNYNTFYSALSPYGNWVYIEGYGQVWQPSIVVSNPTWEPYVQGGRWMYTDAGWYWTSDYSWGWAPFHYGRWFRHYRLGWCWYPDYTWSPAWVSWRWNDGYCGWAALPPSAYYRPGFGLTYWGHHVSVGFSFGLGYGSYTFVSWNNFCKPHYHHHRVDHHHGKSLYDASRPHHQYAGDSHYARNRGPEVDRVSRAVGAPIRRVSLQDTVAYSRGARAERLANDGRTLTVFRPKLDQPASVTRASLRGNDAVGAGASPRTTLQANSLAERRSAFRNSALPATVTENNITTPRRTAERPVPAVSSVSREGMDSRLARLQPTRTTSPGSSDVRSVDPASSLASRQTVTRSGAANNGLPTRDLRTPNTAVTSPSQPVRQSTLSGANRMQRQDVTSSAAPAPAAVVERRSGVTLPSRTTPATAATPNAAPQRLTPASPAAAQNGQSAAPSRVYMGSRQGAPAVNNSQTPRVAQAQTPTPAPNYNLGNGQTRTYAAPTRDFQQPANRAQATPNYTAPAPQRQAPSYSVPQRSVAPAPAYSAPQQRSFTPAPAQSAPQRSFDATPSRSYSAPAQSAPQRSFDATPSRSYSAPSQSAPSRSSSSGGGSAPQRSTAFGNR